MFVATRNTPIFDTIFKMHNSDLYIGGNHEGSLPEDEFKHAYINLSYYSELDLYVWSGIYKITRNYFASPKDYLAKYNEYLNKKAKKT
jgi:hypothetical protein